MSSSSNTWTPRHDTTPAPVQVPAVRRVALWDLPLRLFHWALVAAVIVAVVTGQVGGNWMKVHGWAGISIAGLLAFRIVWGFVGSVHARFLSFVPTPGRLLAYLRGRWRGLGHNPLGALSVLALLGLLSAQALTGLFSNDDIAFTGPLIGLVDEAVSARLTGWHHLVADGLLILLGLHVLAIVFHGLVKKDNLVKPMVVGYKDVSVSPGEAAPAEPLPAKRRGGGWLALLAALSAGIAAVVLASGVWLPEAAPAAGAPAAEQSSPGW